MEYKMLEVRIVTRMDEEESKLLIESHIKPFIDAFQQSVLYPYATRVDVYATLGQYVRYQITFKSGKVREYMYINKIIEFVREIR